MCVSKWQCNGASFYVNANKYMNMHKSIFKFFVNVMIVEITYKYFRMDTATEAVIGEEEGGGGQRPHRFRVGQHTLCTPPPLSIPKYFPSVST